MRLRVRYVRIRHTPAGKIIVAVLYSGRCRIWSQTTDDDQLARDARRGDRVAKTVMRFLGRNK